MEKFKVTNLPYRTLPRYNLMLVRAKENLKFEELVWHPEVFMTQKGFKPGVNILYDLRALQSVSGDLEYLYDSIARMKDPDFIPNPAKTAFCIDPDADKLMRTFKGICTMTEGSRIEHKCLTSLDSALKFLELPESMFQQVEQQLSLIR